MTMTQAGTMAMQGEALLAVAYCSVEVHRLCQCRHSSIHGCVAACRGSMLADALGLLICYVCSSCCWLNGVHNVHRNPAKDTIKNIFLDGIGEAPGSHRRSTSNGLQVSSSNLLYCNSAHSCA
jgi:hypothetical protein